ncbi:MAG: OmpA family protein [Bacteroidota bacterium]
MKRILLFSFCCLLAVAMQAQQTSKTKAAKKLYEKGGSVKVINANAINTTQLEFSPTFYQNGIVFATSRRTQGLRDDNIDETFFELFYAESDGNGLPLKPKEFSVQMNSQLHEGPVTFSRDGATVYFTRNNLRKGVSKAGANGKVHLKIYEAQKGERDWEDIKELSFNSDDFSSCHPTLSADGKKLYFSSDREGGLGGMDLWVVERMADGWSEPINLGAEINTEKNEVFPFIHSSGNLFFASNGYAGAGGLDLYMIDLSGKKWGKATNLGEPFNSTGDDLGLILDPTGTTGYFASDREGGRGKDDIYLFEAPDGIWGRTTPLSFNTTISVFDESTSDAISGADIRIFERTSDGFVGNGNDLYEAILMPVEDGSSELVFKLVRKDASQLGAPDKVSDAQGQAIHEFLGESRYLILVSKDGYASKEVVYSTIGNTGAPTIEVPLGRRTCADLTGVVKDKTTNANIPNALVAIWSGCEGSEEIVRTDAQGNFTYCLPPGCEYMVKGSKENYTSEYEKLSTASNSGPLSATLMLSPLGNTSTTPTGLTSGSVIVLENIYYDFNKSYIRTGAARELDELLALMRQHPSMKIELGSHTDARGSNQYNQRLSDRRAASAKEYLVSRGIAGSRIAALGFGEGNLRNKCSDGVNCSEEEHQYNRRTEVRVTAIDTPLDVRYEDSGPKVIDRRNKN